MADIFKMAAILNFRMANVIYQKINSQRVPMPIYVLVSTFERFSSNMHLSAPLSAYLFIYLFIIGLIYRLLVLTSRCGRQVRESGT